MGTAIGAAATMLVLIACVTACTALVLPVQRATMATAAVDPWIVVGAALDGIAAAAMAGVVLNVSTDAVAAHFAPVCAVIAAGGAVSVRAEGGTHIGAADLFIGATIAATRD